MKTKGGCLNFFCVFLIVWVMLGPRLFYFQNTTHAESITVLINEVAWMGTVASANDEWIELYNKSAGEINLDGWKLKSLDGSPEISLSGTIGANSFYLLERTDDDSVPAKTADLIYAGALGNDGENLDLLDSSGAVVDSIAGGAWLGGDNTSKQTMSRTETGEWKSSASVGGTPAVQNDFASENNESHADETENIVTEQTSPVNTTNSPQVNSSNVSVFINEIVSDPSDDEGEWIELYFAGATANIGGWTIEDGSGAKTTLSGTIGQNTNTFLVLEKPKGNLNNSGDLIILKNEKGDVIDKLVYGDWDDGVIASHASVANDPNSLARKIDGQNTGNNAIDFVVTKTKTKAKTNVITDTGLTDTSKPSPKTTSDNIIISEILPNPVGADETAEYIELYNFGDEPLDLLEWQIGDESSERFRFKESKLIGAHGFLVLYRKDTGIAMNNSGDTISLYKIDRKTALDKLKYENAIEGMSLNCLDKDLKQLGKLANLDCAWSKALTPGAVSKIVLPNREPLADFSVSETIFVNKEAVFDASDCVDPDGDKLKYFWDFGDGDTSNDAMPMHIYKLAGAFPVVLQVYDGEFEVETEKTINIIGWNNDGTANEQSLDMGIDYKNIKINKLLPNPVGTDSDGEWIEIMNNGKTKINLLNWQLDDAEGGSKPYTFKDSLYIPGNSSYKMFREDSGLALNNTSDSVRLLAPNSTLVDSVDYAKGKEGQVYVRDKVGKWQWLSEYSDEEIVGGTVGNKSVKAKTVASDIVKKLEINLLSESNIGEQVELTGTVTVLPGVFGTQYFYIEDGGGLQIYSNKKDFPELKIGDALTARGEISSVSGELRLKTKTSADIVVTGNNKILEPRVCACEDIKEMELGSLVSVKGTVVKKQSTGLFLDDGTEEVLAYIKASTGIKLDKIKAGDEIAVSGILTSSVSGRRLQPRSAEDIVLTSKNNIDIESGKVMGEVSEESAWTIASRNKNQEIYIYAIMIIVAGAMIVGIWLYRKKKKSKDE